MLTFYCGLNAGFAAGTRPPTSCSASPWLVARAGLGGRVFALVTRRSYPQRYELLGRVVLDVRERREMDTDELQVVRPRGGRHGA